jgi:uncharacterized protein (TIGR02270 family)
MVVNTNSIFFEHEENGRSLQQQYLRCARDSSFKLESVSRIYQRIRAASDGLVNAKKNGFKPSWQADIADNWSWLFVQTIVTMESRDLAQFSRVISVAQTSPAAIDILVSASSCNALAKMQEMLLPLIESTNPLIREIGLRIFAEHRIGEISSIAAMLGQALQEEQFQIASWALRVAGDAGLSNGLHSCQDFLNHPHTAVSTASAYTAVLLGDRENGKSMLTKAALKRSSLQDEAILLSLRVNDSVVCQHLMKDLASQAKAESATPHEKRILLIAAGYSGDVGMVNWLFTAMEHRATARLAGVAFSMITGADLALLDLDQPPPADFEEGPNDDPDDDSIEMDADSGAAWPDVAKVKAWYAQSGLAEMKGQRLLCGQPQSIKAALDTLRNGFQNQRRVAAYDLALLDPGKPLFHWYEDPAQQKIKMDALDARFGIKRENPYPYVSVFARM